MSILNIIQLISTIIMWLVIGLNIVMFIRSLKFYRESKIISDKQLRIFNEQLKELDRLQKLK